MIVENSGTYGRIYFATSWEDTPLIEQTGINEQGLCFDANWIPPTPVNQHPERPSAEEWVVTYLMKECATIAEVLQQAFKYDISGWGGTPMSYQVHFADATGDAVVIHPGTDGELNYTRKTEGDGYLVSTNFNLVDPQPGVYPCQRYETATEMLEEIKNEETLTVEYARSILDAVHMEEGQIKTLYSTIYDLPKRLIYLYYFHQFEEVVVLDVAEELAKGDRMFLITELFPQEILNRTLPEFDLLRQFGLYLTSIIGSSVILLKDRRNRRKLVKT